MEAKIKFKVNTMIRVLELLLVLVSAFYELC